MSKRTRARGGTRRYSRAHRASQRRLFVLALAVVLVLLTVTVGFGLSGFLLAPEASLASQVSPDEMKAEVRPALERFCTEYGCSEGYLEENVGRIFFVDREDYLQLFLEDQLIPGYDAGVPESMSLAYTTNLPPRKVVVLSESVHWDGFQDCETPSQALGEILDHELIHRDAPPPYLIESVLSLPITIAGEGGGRRVITWVNGASVVWDDNQSSFLPYDEALTEYFAQVLHPRACAANQFSSDLRLGPGLVARAHEELHLERQEVYEAYRRLGWLGLVEIYGRVLVPVAEAQGNTGAAMAIDLISLMDNQLQKIGALEEEMVSQGRFDETRLIQTASQAADEIAEFIGSGQIPAWMPTVP